MLPHTRTGSVGLPRPISTLTLFSNITSSARSINPDPKHRALRYFTARSRFDMTASVSQAYPCSFTVDPVGSQVHPRPGLLMMQNFSSPRFSLLPPPLTLNVKCPVSIAQCPLPSVQMCSAQHQSRSLSPYVVPFWISDPLWRHSLLLLQNARARD